MPPESTTSFLDALRRSPLLEPAQLPELEALAVPCADPRALAKELLERGWLTAYQVNRVFQGKGDELLLGPYLLLERLGAGGMGEVFKARHRRLGRVVAVKVIRREKLARPDAVRRFEREVRAAAQLDHPNVVHAYDADRVGATHFFVMEYVPGTDLSKLVKKHGPLPVAQACACIRQAALGLQHAHERGLVHRDIKPSNLLLTRAGSGNLPSEPVVKILDLGMALVEQPAGDEDSISSLTQDGQVMGTPDYVAPEQSLDSHDVDIRADLYSLGCTLYFLLTGQVPFPGGGVTQKLMRHQLREPRPLEELRPDVPPEVAAIVRKLMAKKPEDRFQTPAELADALAAVTGPAAAVELPRLPPAPASADEEVFATLDTCDAATAPDAPPKRSREAVCRLVLLNAVGGAVLLGLVVLLLYLLQRPGRAPAPPPDAASTRETAGGVSPPGPDRWLKEVAGLPAEKQVEAVARRLRERNPGFDGKLKPTIADGVVTGLELRGEDVADLAPLQALPALKTLVCAVQPPATGRLADLRPLHGLGLTVFRCNRTRVTDLGPLQGMPLAVCAFPGCPVVDLAPLREMPLTALHCDHTPVADLTPLRGLRLKVLTCEATMVADLTPLVGMPLTSLNCRATPVSDLAPLRGLPLTFLDCRGTAVTDLAPLRGLPLKALRCDFRPGRDAEVLHGIAPLERVNDLPSPSSGRRPTRTGRRSPNGSPPSRSFRPPGSWPPSPRSCGNATPASTAARRRASRTARSPGWSCGPTT